jgi:hypothetical protein
VRTGPNEPRVTAAMGPIASSSQDWRGAFLAVCAVVGVPFDAGLVAMGGGEAGRDDALEALARAMNAASREVRARAIARALTPVAADLERVRLA